MSTLHLLNTSSNEKLQRCLSHYQAGDAVLLINDAVYLSLQAQFNAAKFNCYALSDDCQARGLTLSDKIKSASYNDFVQLSTSLDKSISWY